jgi:hypothetical protein
MDFRRTIQIHDELLQVLGLPGPNLNSTAQEFLRTIRIRMVQITPGILAWPWSL